MAVFAKFVIGLAGIYGLLVAALYFGQRSLMYHPDRARVAPAQVGLSNVSEEVLATPDGNRLIAWYAKPQDGRPTIVYFHGNAGNLTNRAERVARFQTQGWGVFILGYRSFGGSTGSPSEEANIADGRLALQWLAGKGIKTGDVVLYGESLGTGIATQLAASNDCAGLILDAPFTSMVDAAAYHYPWMWVRPFVTDRYDSASFIIKVKSRILILHGELDRVVPVAMGLELARIAGERTTLTTFKDGDHTNLYDHGGFEKIVSFVNAVHPRR